MMRLILPALCLTLAACSAAPIKTEIRPSSSRSVPEGLDPVEGVWEGAPMTAEERAAEARAEAAAASDPDPGSALPVHPVTAIPAAATTPSPRPAAPQNGGGPTAEEIAQANNPLANFTAVNFHNYYIPDLTDVPDVSANNAWLRYAHPYDGWLIRASLPINRYPTSPTSSESGLGDFNVFAAYLMTEPSSPTTFGVGPLLVVPTASDDALGSGKWQAGAAAVYFNAESKQIQFGGLLTFQTDFAGKSSRADTALLAMQPFGMFQMGGGSYLRSTGIWAFNLDNGNYNVPIGVGFGKVFKLESGDVLNVFIEPQMTVLSDGAGQPAFQVFFGVNTQFM